MRTELDHLGIAVTSIAEALPCWTALGLVLEGVEEVASQGVRVAMLPIGGTRVELLEAIAPDSPIARHLERRGPGLHHLCLRVADVRQAMARLAGEGFQLLTDEPQPGARGALVCFVHPRSSGGVLIELSQPGTAEP